jgi:hypothetical protein
MDQLLQTLSTGALGFVVFILALVIGVAWLILPFAIMNALKKIHSEIAETNCRLTVHQASMEQQCKALNAMLAYYEPPADSKASTGKPGSPT